MRAEAEVALRSPRNTDDYRRVIENLLDEAIKLGAVADQLLFLCRQDAGLLPPTREELDGGALVREVVETMRVVAEEKGVTLSADGVATGRLVTDGRLVRRVLYILLDNAIKFTDTGGQVTVTSQADDGQLTVTVSDSGIGIPAEHLARVFERFYRVDPARAGDRPGAGLGLAICRSITRALGGTISLESSFGAGTSARLFLPLDAPTLADAQSANGG
jgi:two-component system, OmpR family, heavy metal sensor histidine kinase CusS